MNAERIAKALGGRPSGKGWLVPCPVFGHGKGHGDRNRSLSVADGETALLVKCFAGCDVRDVLDALRKRGLVEDDRDDRKHNSSPIEPPAPKEPEPDPKALRLWLAGVQIVGTIGQAYLEKGRCLTPPFPPSIRFARIQHESSNIERPTIIAAVQRPDRKIIAVQVTYLFESARKLPGTPRLTHGALGTGAIHLAAVDDVMGLAEGTETAMSAMRLTGIPCWATLGAWRMHAISIPDTIKTVHVFGDNDDPGRKAAERAADRYARDGKRVFVRFPPAEFNDYNDLLIARCRAESVAA